MATQTAEQRVGGWRQARQQVVNDRSRSGGKNRQWSLRLKITSVPTKIHPQRPTKPFKDLDYDLHFWWLRGKTHFVKNSSFPKGRGFECGIDECLVCAYGNPAAFGFENVTPDPSLSKCDSRSYYSISGWIEQTFHLVEKPKDKEVQQGEKSTFTVRERCQGRNCEFCKKNLQKVFGNRFFYDFSPAAWDNAVLPVIEKLSRRAKDGGYVYPVNYVCEECGTEIFDVTQNCFSCNSDDIGIDPDEDMAICQACDEKWPLLEYEDEAF